MKHKNKPSEDESGKIAVIALTEEYAESAYGGAGRHVTNLVKSLTDVDIQVRRFGTQGERSDDKSTAYPSWDHLQEDHFGGVLRTIACNLAIADDPINADVVHAHTRLTTLAGFLCKQLYELPLVVTVHSTEPGRPWKKEALGTGYSVSLWSEQVGIEAADAIITVSKSMKQEVLSNFDVDNSTIDVVPNGVDTETFRPVESSERLRARNVDPKRPYVLFVGRISRQKGIVQFLDAVQRLDADVEVVVRAGAAESETVAEQFKNRIADLQSTGINVTLIDEYVEAETLVELYSHAELVVTPSRYEPFGLVNLEAMACGTPVVSTDVGGIPDVVRSGNDGLLVPMCDEKDATTYPADFETRLADAIMELLADDKRRRRMAESAQRRATEFSWRSVANQTQQIYERLS